MKDIIRVRFLLFAAGIHLLTACAGQTVLSSSDIDEVVSQAMLSFNVPGVAVGVIKDGQIVHSAAYGVREIGQPGRVDGNTLFRIASTTKAINTAALAILVDEGLLAWDDKVVRHLPEFQLYDPWITQHFTVTDLLTHRSGLVPYAGDLMLWPKPNRFTRQDILHGLRYFKPSREFRTGYDYDNLLYIVAGELMPAVTGAQWETFVDRRIFGPLQTRRCFAGQIPREQMQNLAAPHAPVEGALQVIERNRINANTAIAAAAGGVRCSVDDMLRWLQLQLNKGMLPDGTRLWSEQQSDTMWRPYTYRQVSKEEAERDGTHFKAYGLGWRLADVHGFKQVHHTGSFTGFNSYVVLIPELNLAAVVLLNASAGDARSAIMNAIIRPYLGDRDMDWVDYYSRESAANNNAVDATPDIDYTNGAVDSALADYSGTYTDAWFGDVSITLVGNELWFASAKSSKLTGRLLPQEHHTFMLRWQDRSAERDVFIDFVSDGAGEFTKMEIRCLAETIQCAFEDQEMNFFRDRDR